MQTVPRTVTRLFPNVTKLKEASSPLDIEVTTRDVKSAKRLAGDQCAIANAVCRQEKADGAVIGLSYSYVIRGNTATKYMTSTTAGREITSFDRNHDFHAGEYRLSALPPSQKRAAARKRAKDRRAAGEDMGDRRPGRDRKSKRRIVHKETVNVRSFRRKDG